MSTVLVVDDSTVDRKLAGGCLRNAGLEILYAQNGREALELVQQTPPDLVLTDMVMPEMGGLELVRELRKTRSGLPVILMTAHGSEETAVTALQAGAASYVPKKNLGRDLAETVFSVLSVASRQQAERQALDSLKHVDLVFELGNDLASVRPVVLQIQSYLRQLSLCDDSEIVRISTALQEALVNAIEHGNLELDSSLRELPDDTYSRIGDDRRSKSPWCDRHVHVSARLSREGATWTIRDEGPGFNPGSLPDPTDPANLQKVSGRGLLLIRTFMDDVTFNERANEITMTKRCSASALA